MLCHDVVMPDLVSSASEGRPVLLIVDVADGGRIDPGFEVELQELTAGVVEAATELGFAVDRVPAAQAGPEELLRRLRVADAVVVTGGEDVDPSFYGGRLDDPRLGQTFPDADRAQIALIREAVAARVPTIGICRGMQIVNVALGGDLVQHIEDGAHVGLGSGDESMVDHVVAIDADSAMAKLLGATEFEVRSSHHQAIDRPADALVVVGRSDDGVIEAVEHESAPLWCVQWHPEDPGSKGSVLPDLLRGALGAIRDR